jgi:hypothetical protein
MCTLIDMNTIACVFNPSNQDYINFEPIRDWLNTGNGKVVYGGLKYKTELAKLPKYHTYLTELSRKGKVVKVDDDLINKKTIEIENDLMLRGINSKKNEKFNDSHLVAIVAVSKVKIITSKDSKSFDFLKDTRYYDHAKHKPVFYTSKKNSKLLEDKRYHSCCCN